MWLDLRKGSTWSRTKILRFCYHFEADSERSTIEFESSHYLNWFWSYCWLKMYMPVHFVWTVKILQACISIQYYAWSAPFCHILSHIPCWNEVSYGTWSFHGYWLLTMRAIFPIMASWCLGIMLSFFCSWTILCSHGSNDILINTLHMHEFAAASRDTQLSSCLMASGSSSDGDSNGDDYRMAGKKVMDSSLSKRSSYLWCK
jgi:hypothetical protein